MDKVMIEIMKQITEFVDRFEMDQESIKGWEWERFQDMTTLLRQAYRIGKVYERDPDAETR